MELINISITNYNRFESTIKSFEQVINDERVGQFLILDDASTDDSYFKLDKHFKDNDKVRIMGNLSNVGMQRNKRNAVALSLYSWVILLDSDNEISTDYIDKLEKIERLYEGLIYAPARALPTFIYDEFAGEFIHRSNVKHFVKKPFFGAMINTSNYFVHKETYCRNYEYNPDIKGTDTANHFYNHLKNGGGFYVVPGLEYQHKISDDSEFMKDVHYNMMKAKEIEEKLLQL